MMFAALIAAAPCIVLAQGDSVEGPWGAANADIAGTASTEEIAYTHDGGVLRREAGAGAQVLAENITGFGFTYLDTNGAAAATVNDIRAVDITLTAAEEVRGETIERSMSTRVRCRNMGL